MKKLIIYILLCCLLLGLSMVSFSALTFSCNYTVSGYDNDYLSKSFKNVSTDKNDSTDEQWLCSYTGMSSSEYSDLKANWENYGIIKIAVEVKNLSVITIKDLSVIPQELTDGVWLFSAYDDSMAHNVYPFGKANFTCALIIKNVSKFDIKAIKDIPIFVKGNRALLQLTVKGEGTIRGRFLD